MTSWVDPIIKQILSIGKLDVATTAGLTYEEIEKLCTKVREIFLDQPVLLELQTPLTICGDIHGQFLDLIRIFDTCKYPPHTNYLFLGDYVDRGLQSIETICLLFAYKIKYPENFFLLRGNHECSYINRDFGFFDECKNMYDVKLWKMFCNVFNCLPIAAVVDDRIFCVHGGLSPDLVSLDQISSIERPIEVPEDGLLCDLLWSDPSEDTDSWSPNDRGASYIFGSKPLQQFLDDFNFDLVVRAHQAVMNGYEFPFSSNPQGLVTLFSAPNYCNEYMNKGATMQVNEDLLCSFSVLQPIQRSNEYFIGPRPGTPPRGSEPQFDEFKLSSTINLR